MDAQKIPQLKAHWEELNAVYDAYIQDFLDNPTKNFNKEEIAQIKRMQDELYAVENELFTLIEKEIKHPSEN